MGSRQGNRARALTPPRMRTMPAVAIAAALTLVLSIFVPTLTSPAVSPAAAVAPTTGLDVSATGSSFLVGGSGEIAVQVTNTSGVDQFNMTAVAVLPPGVDYVPGSALPAPPAGPGEPTVTITRLPDTAPGVPGPEVQVLTWTNVADIPIDADTEIRFSVTADADQYPAGSTFDVDVRAYTSEDEREVPDVTVPVPLPESGPEVDEADAGGQAVATSTRLPITITKTETQNAENEVYRGEANPAEFQLVVTPSTLHGTENVVVVDRVPAQFQVTDAGGADVEIVEIDGEVFTQLTWHLGTVTETQTLTYSAFVGLREITSPGGEPTGDPTRPGAQGTAVTNTATLAGTYLGPVAAGGSADVSVEDSETVEILDVGIVKTRDAGTFAGGQSVQFRLHVRTSQFVEATGVTITDTIPNGMCPILPDSTSWTTAPPPACTGNAPVTITPPASVTSITATPESDGSFTVQFAVAGIPEDADVALDYTVLMRNEYSTGAPTATGDAFTNEVAISADVSPAPGNDVDQGTEQVTDDSSATTATSEVGLSKSVWMNEGAAPIEGISTCTEQGDYTSPPSGPLVQLGDLVCFRIDVTFPTGTSTLGVVLGDFLPPGTSLVDWAASATGTTATRVGTGETPVLWQLGEDVPGVGRFVPPGADTSIYVLARVDRPAQSTADLTGNLAKLRYTAGERTIALRDTVPIRIAAAPNLALDKSTPGLTGTPPLVDVGQVVPYQVVVRHDGTEAAGDTSPVTSIQVRDRLPVGVTCGAVSAISDGGSCSDGFLSWTLLAGGSLPAGGLTPGNAATLTYTVTIPTGGVPSATLTNTAAVTEFRSPIADGRPGQPDVAVYVPLNPFGSAVESNVPREISGTASVRLREASVTKTLVSTSVTDPNNSDTQATIGETATYVYSVTVPRGTTIYGGRLLDVMTAANIPRFVVTSVAMEATPSGVSVTTNGATGTACAPSTIDFVLCTGGESLATGETGAGSNSGAGRLLFPTNGWSAPAGEDVTFSVRVTGRVANVTANGHGSNIPDTAHFVRADAPGGQTRSVASEGRTLPVVVASPTITKTATPTSGLTGGQQVTYTLVSSQGTGRPPLYSPTVVDCIDLRMTNITYVPGSSIFTGPTMELGTGFNGCALGTTKLTFTTSSPADKIGASGQTLAQRTITYTARVPDPVAAGEQFTNIATLSGTTLESGVTGVRPLSSGARSANVTANQPTITKQRLSPATAVPGQPVSWQVQITLQPGVAHYNPMILDTLPEYLGPASGATVAVTCSWGACGGQSILTDGQTLGVLLTEAGEPGTAARTVTLDITSTLSTDIDEDVVGPLTNTARFTWDRLASEPAPTVPELGDRSTGPATAQVGVRHPAVTTAKSVSTPTPGQDQVFTYTVTAAASTAAATAGVTAYDVTIVDEVPVGVVVDEATISGGGAYDSAARTITWELAELVPGTPVDLTYAAELAPAAALQRGVALTNTVHAAEWFSLAEDGKQYGPSDVDTASVTPQAPNVTTAKHLLAANPVYIGDDVPYRLTFTNTGGAPALQFSVSDALPLGWEYVAGSTEIRVDDALVAAVEPSAAGAPATLTWADILPEGTTLATNGVVTIYYETRPTDGVEVGESIPQTNTARAVNVRDLTGGTHFAGEPADSFRGPADTATARIHSADVGVEKRATGDWIAGQTGTFEIVVTNHGPDPAVGVSVTDVFDLPLPDGVTLDSIVGVGWTCSDGECVRTVATETLGVDASFPEIVVTVELDANLPADTSVTNTATVSSRTEDRVPANNTSTATGTVDASADLEIEKTGPTSVDAGDPITWNITLRNLGPSVSRGSVANPIVLTDEFPSEVTGVEFVGAAPDGCEIDGGVLTCTIERDLAVNEVITFAVRGTVSSGVAEDAIVSNTADVTPVTTDPNGDNNSDTWPTTVTHEESLLVSKDTTVEEAHAGTRIPYTVSVYNGGPSDALGVFVVDTLPAPLSDPQLTAEAVAAGWSIAEYDEAANTVRFAYSTPVVAQTDAPALTYSVYLADSYVGEPLTNTVIVGSAWNGNQDDAQETVGAGTSADLSIVKSVSGPAVAGGEGASYTLTVDNLGPSDAAASVIVHDLLPLGVRLDGGAPVGCEVTEQIEGETVRDLVICTREGLAAAADPWVIVLPVVVDADVTASQVVNLATVSSPTPDPDLENNVSTVPLEIRQIADLNVTKVAQQDVVTAGDDVEWVITVRNEGPSDAASVVLTDVLDSRLTLVSATPSQGECGPGATCTLGVIPVGGEVTITLVTTVSSAVVDGSIIENTATATSTTNDAEGNPASGTNSDTIGVVAVTALSLVKTTLTETVDAGAVARFALELRNLGPSDAAAPVMITDTLPEGMTFLAASTVGGPALWSCAPTDGGSVVDCTLTDADGAPVTLAARATAPTLQIAANVDVDAEQGEKVNRALASSPSSPDGADAESPITITASADLGITKTHDADVDPVAGLPFTWTLTVENGGPSHSLASIDDPIVIRDVLPEGVSFDAESPSGGPDTTCSVTGTEGDREVVECFRTAQLNAGDQFEITLPVLLDEALEGTVANTATVAPGLTPEPPVSVLPNESTDEIEIVEIADLALEKSILTDPVIAGSPVTWEIAITNLGPSNSDADADSPIRVIDTLPAGITGATASGEGWTCETTPGDVEQIACERDSDLPVGAAPVITVTGTLSASAVEPIVNSAIVEPGRTRDHEAENDTDSVEAPVTALADLAITKVIAEDIVAGAQGVYRLQVTNHGPSDAVGVAVVDLLPEGLTFRDIAATDADWVCAGDAEVECLLTGALAAGATTTLDIRVDAVADLAGDIENVALVSADTPDPNLENNEARIDGTVAEVADLAIVKTALGEARVGDELTFALEVTNNGPALARGVVVTDDVPAGLTVVSVEADAEGWVCGSTPGADGTAVVCTIDELPPGATAVISVRVIVEAEAFPEFTNTATIISATPEDPSTRGDNESSVTVPVPPSSTLTLEKTLVGDTLYAGHTAWYDLTVANEGPTLDPGPIIVTDILPEGLAFERASIGPETLSCEVDGQVVVCETGGLAVGEERTVRIQVAVAADAQGTLTNIGTVESEASPGPGPVPGPGPEPEPAPGPGPGPGPEPGPGPDPEPSPGPGPQEDHASAEVDGSDLPLTGSTSLGYPMLIALLLLAGGLLLVARRQRVRASED